jgi:hypothetical protein
MGCNNGGYRTRGALAGRKQGMNKAWMTFILVTGAVVGTFIGTRVISEAQKDYTEQLEETVKTLESDLVETQLQLRTLQIKCFNVCTWESVREESHERM